MKIKYIITALFLAAVFLLPVSLNAQSDGFFRGGEGDNYGNRASDVILDGSGMSLGGATYENPTAPIGSGLLIMVAAGAGYMAAKRKRSFRNGGTLLLACAMLLTLTQCKKKVDTLTDSDNSVFITLNVTKGGDKTVFNPSTCQFTWTKDVTEYIYVGGDQHPGCIGVLSGMATKDGVFEMSFSGTVEGVGNGEKLHFFYLGQGDERTGDKLGEVDFSNQDGTLGNITKYHIAYNDDVVEYTTGTTTYNATLNMKMAIAYFNVSGFTNNNNNNAETVYLHGDDVYATATVNYQEGTITPGTKGYIKIGPATSGKYVALVPSTTSGTTIKFNSDSKDGDITFLRGIQAAKYYSNNNYALEIGANGLDSDVIPALFSVGGKKVAYTYSVIQKMIRFSKGNLQYQASNDKWRFAEHQYDFVGGTFNNNSYGNVEGSTNNNPTSTYEGWIDLFGWGTSGYNNRDPYMTSMTSKDYDVADSLIGTNYDWGYNTIYYGDTQTTGWRSLSCIEWRYLLGNLYYVSIVNNQGAGEFYRDIDNRFLKAKIDVGDGKDHYGIIIFPDSYDAGSLGLSGLKYNNYNRSIANYVNVTNVQWTDMVNAGAAFIPAAGRRNGVNYQYLNTNMGGYWTASRYSSSNTTVLSNHLYFYDATNDYESVQIEKQGENGSTPVNTGAHMGYSVRLVRDVN